MTPQNPNFDPLLDQAIAEIRDEPLDPAVIAAAAGRVQAHLAQHTPLRSCADFQALIPEYRAGTLSEARALLLKDHTHECIACYKALKAGPPAAIRPPRTARAAWLAVPRWAIAATVLIAAGLTAWGVATRLRPAIPSEVTVQSADGMLYRASDNGSTPLVRGAAVPSGAIIRTARGSHAMLRLRDGSLVEMRERSGFSVTESGRDMTIALDRGAIIVQAAKRHAGHLYVATRDCRVAVTGTVFSVNSGIKGSRVTVIEGTVLVTQDRHQDVLHAGDQVSTSPTMAAVPVRQEIAWSHNLDAHLAMLNAVTALNKGLDQAHFPSVRFASNLLSLVPAQTVVYASIPNLNEALSEVQQVFRPKLRENADLAQWWDQNKLDQAISDMSTMSGYLGDEMIIAASLNSSGRLGQPLLLAELKHPGFADFAQAQLAKMQTNGHGPKIRVATDPAAIGSIEPGQAVLLVMPSLVALSPDAGVLRQVASGAPGQFAGTEFGSQIMAAYGSGVGLLFAADLQAIAPASHHGPLNVQYLMVQQTANGGAPETRGSLIFKGARTGVASWLAAPAPLGSLDFISPDATFVWAAAVKQPSAIIDEITARSPQLQQKLAEVQSLLGIDVRNDLAAALGGEIAGAQDGPLLPTPSWKVAVEVYDSARLQATIAKLVDAANSDAALHGSAGIQLQQQTANGRTYYTLSSADHQGLPEIHYIYTDGYLLAAPSQALLDRAIQSRATGYTLARSAAFTALIPRDQYANFSAMVYYNVGSSLSPLIERFNNNQALTDKQQQTLQEIAGNLKPTLIAAYGEPDRITFATNGSLFNMTLGNMSLLELLKNPGTTAQPQTYRR
jgi:FecR protein